MPSFSLTARDAAFPWTVKEIHVVALEHVEGDPHCLACHLGRVVAVPVVGVDEPQQLDVGKLVDRRVLRTGGPMTSPPGSEAVHPPKPRNVIHRNGTWHQRSAAPGR
jgi:hypothetical protein